MPDDDKLSSDEDIELSLKKKKKKKKAVKKKVDSDDEGSDQEAPAKEANEEVQKAAAPVEAAGSDVRPAKVEDSDEEDLETFYANLKLKKKKKKHSDVLQSGTVDWDALQHEDRDYTYAEILSRVYEKIKTKNPTIGMKTVHKIRPPNVQRDGTKKVAFTNFADICKSLNRSQEHLFNYTLTELGTTGNIDGNNCLILKGRLTAKHIEGLLRKYLDAYVTCSMCHSLETKLVKDPHSRLTTLCCNQCNASRTVQSITGGFSAQIGRRKKK